MSNVVHLGNDEDAQRIELLDELEDARLEMQAHHGTWSSIVGRAIDWIDEERQALEGESGSAVQRQLTMSTTPLPVCDDGALALVVLDRKRLEARGIEYYGQPVVVSRWSGKLKTTVEALRLGYDDVVSWCSLVVAPAGE